MEPAELEVVKFPDCVPAELVKATVYVVDPSIENSLQETLILYPARLLSIRVSYCPLYR